MMGLSDGERISMIRSAVLIQYAHVMDGQTDGQTELAWHIRAIAYMLLRIEKAARARNMFCNFFCPRTVLMPVFGCHEWYTAIKEVMPHQFS